MKFFQIILAILSSVAVASTALVTTDKESANHCHPENPNPEPYKISYEDGTESPSIRLRLWGDDHDSSITFEETLNGFTVGPSTTNDARGGTLKYYTYRDVNLKTGELFDTGLIVGKANPQSNNINKFAAAKSERIKKNNENDKNDKKSKKSKKSKKKGNKKSKNDIRKHRTLRRRQGREFVNIPDEEGQSNRRVSTIASGTMKNLVVPFKFKDHASRDLPSRSDLDILMNNNGPAPQCPTGSVRDVYKQNSYNTLDMQSTVVDWITIDYTEAECAGGKSALNSASAFFKSTCLINALDKLNATGFNFADFDVNGDGFMDGMAFLHSGYGAEFKGDIDAYFARYEDRIWSHRGSIGVTWKSNGVRVYDYHISPSVWDTSGSDIGRIGVIAHETGHFLGLPDLYDYGDGNGMCALGF